MKAVKWILGAVLTLALSLSSGILFANLYRNPIADFGGDGSFGNPDAVFVAASALACILILLAGFFAGRAGNYGVPLAFLLVFFAVAAYFAAVRYESVQNDISVLNEAAPLIVSVYSVGMILCATFLPLTDALMPGSLVFPAAVFVLGILAFAAGRLSKRD